MSRPQKQKQETPALCPVCGEDVPRGAVACPECGADHNSGWREGAESYDGLDLPEDFDYEEFAHSEFGSSPKPAGLGPLWWLTGVALVFLTLLYLLLTR